MELPLPWERLLWSGRPVFTLHVGERYVLTDLRLVATKAGEVTELLLHDVGDIHRSESRLDRLLGLSTLVAHPRNARTQPLVLRRVRRGAQLAALIEWLATETDERPARFDAAAVRSAIAWNPQRRSGPVGALASLTVLLGIVFGIVMSLHGKAAPSARHAPDDPIYPNGERRSDVEIVRFMQDEVMPWARAALGPIKGGPDRITCETCHGPRPQSRGWQMPAVMALPQPDVKDKGWEQYGGPMDSQMRNAIYGYLAESDKQPRAAYMREIVMPGMARLLHRPAYDFTRTYEFNRSHLTFGCYHCHLVN